MTVPAIAEAQTRPAMPRVSPGRTQSLLPWFFCLTALLGILDGGLHGDMFTLPDTDAYLQMASGQGALVPQPFSLRQLGPLLAGGLHRLLHIDLSTAYIGLGVLTFSILIAIVGLILVRSRVNPWWLVVIGGLSFWSTLFNGLVLSDLLFASLLGIFASLLYKGHILGAALMLLPLELTRESTILVLLCFLIAGWKRMGWLQVVAAVVATFSGMQIVKAMIAGGLGNHDQLSFPAYMAGKLLWNSTYNLFGFPMWTNLSMNTHCSVPQWKIAAHLGGIREIGFCTWDPAQILCTLRTALGCFGLLPLLFVHVWRTRKPLKSGQNVLIRFTMAYGVCCFLLAAELGPSIARLFGYSWPVFLLATPLLASGLMLSKNSWISLVVVHLLVSWSGWLLGYKQQGLAFEALLLLAIGAGYALGIFLLRVSTQVPSPAPDQA